MGFCRFRVSDVLRSGTSLGNAQLGSLNVSLQISGLNLAVWGRASGGGANFGCSGGGPGGGGGMLPNCVLKVLPGGGYGAARCDAALPRVGDCRPLLAPPGCALGAK